MISRILIVDDDRVSCAIVKDALLEFVKSSEIDLSTTEEEVCRVIGEKEYDLVIVTSHLPRMNGLELLKRLREVQPRIQAILIGSEAVEAEAFALGLVYLTKPFSLDTLFNAVQEALKRCGKEMHTGNPAWLIECLAEGLLHLYNINAPPVPVESMVRHPYNTFANLSEPVGRSGDEWESYHRRAAWARSIYWRLLHDEEFSRLAGVFQISGEKKEADYFVRALLMPLRWMADLEKSSIESLAHQFQVPPYIVMHRLRELSTSRPLLNPYSRYKLTYGVDWRHTPPTRPNGECGQ